MDERSAAKPRAVRCGCAT
ncbi:hypothetical protein [Mycobacterium sp. 663a-19]